MVALLPSGVQRRAEHHREPDRGTRAWCAARRPSAPVLRLRRAPSCSGTRHSGGPAFGDVLVIGAGSGNDVSRALAWGAHHVDAVEIDPAIQRLGARDHPDHPYQDPRVTVHIGDGRNFLRVSPARYDLIVFALVDSLVLHSSYSNIRLESFLFTQEAFTDVQTHLKPGGVFVMYNLFRQGWIVDRLSQELQSTFRAISARLHAAVRRHHRTGGERRVHDPDVRGD